MEKSVTVTSPSYNEPFTKSPFFKIIPIVIGVIFVLFVADQGLRNWELNSLVAEVQASESQMNEINDRHSETSKDYWNGNEWTDFYSAEQDYANVAQQFGPAVHSSKVKVSRVFILSWHSALSRARNDYMAHQTAWEKSLNFELSTTDELLYSEELSGSIRSTWDVVQDSMPNSVPLVDLSSNKAKIELIVGD